MRVEQTRWTWRIVLCASLSYPFSGRRAGVQDYMENVLAGIIDITSLNKISNCMSYLRLEVYDFCPLRYNSGTAHV